MLFRSSVHQHSAEITRRTSGKMGRQHAAQTQFGKPWVSMTVPLPVAGGDLRIGRGTIPNHEYAENLGQVLDEDRALGPQAFDDVAIVHDLMADVDRRAIERQRPLDRVDGANHPGAEAAGGAKVDLESRFG